MKPNAPASKTKTYLTVGIIVVVLVIAYLYFTGGSSPSAASLLQSSTASVGSEDLALLNQVRSIHIDTTLFSSPVYQSLQDYSVPIDPQNVSRPDPFAPIPGVPNPTDNASGQAASGQVVSGKPAASK